MKNYGKPLMFSRRNRLIPCTRMREPNLRLTIESPQVFCSLLTLSIEVDAHSLLRSIFDRKNGVASAGNHAAACLLTPRYVALRNRTMDIS